MEWRVAGVEWRVELGINLLVVIAVENATNATSLHAMGKRSL
jgi:hypothetical protein